MVLKKKYLLSIRQKVGIYKYRITEVAGSDTEVDYDEMSVTATLQLQKRKTLLATTWVSMNILLRTLQKRVKMTKEKKGTNVSATNPKRKTGTDTEFQQLRSSGKR